MDNGNRNQLFTTLKDLPQQIFEQLLFALKLPGGLIPSAEAPQANRVKALLDWAEGSSGPGLDEIRHQLKHIEQSQTPQFEAYLRSLKATYENWREYYTPTDAVGKVEQPKPKQPSVFDFGLMVQTVEQPQTTDDLDADPNPQKQEKTERLPVLAGIRKYADVHVLLMGRPGSGKSTALIRLLLEEAAQLLKLEQSSAVPRAKSREGETGFDSAQPSYSASQATVQIPVLVELRYWQTSVLERIRAFLYRHDPQLDLDDAALTTLLRQGRFLLLFDGLNELPSDDARTQLVAFRRDYAKVPMIFTTRDLGLGGDLGIEKKLEMQPLTEAQMKQFIRAYVPEQAEVMLRQLSSRLREFGQTPLLLWMLCEVFQQSPNRQLPNNLAEVFRAFTTMYADSSVRKHEVALLKGDVRPLSDRRLWKEALMALAARMMQGETPVDFRVAIHRTEAERELSKRFAKENFPVRDILDDLLKYHLLQNRSADQLEFRHQLIQEYYAAEHLLDLLPQLNDERLKRDYLNLLKWTEPIALMLALMDDEAQALRVVKLAMNDVDLILGSNLIESVHQQYQRHAAKMIKSLMINEATEIGILKLTESRAIANYFVENLRLLGSNASREMALTLHELGFLKSGDIKGIEFPEKKSRNYFFNTTAIEFKFEDLKWFEDNLTIQSLSDDISELQEYLQDELWREGEIGDGSLEENLLSTLNRVNTIQECLSDSSDDSELILGIIEILGSSIPQVRSRTVKILSMLGGIQSSQNIILSLEDINAEVRKAAAEALLDLDENSNAVEGLLKRLEKEIDDDVRCAILNTLGELAEPKHISVILLASQPKTRGYYCLSTIAKIQNRCKFYNYEIWQSTIPQGKAISLYFSYAPADEALQTQLANHLTLLKRQGVITSWSQRQILPGDEPTQVINQHLNTADIILLLISANSLADDTCYNLEIQRAIERHQSGEACVIPILLRPVDWAGVPFSQLPVLPKNHQPVTLWDNRDAAFQEIAEGIRAVAMEVRKDK
ncbi:TIR domain-containing protein [Nodosilinea sp. LEGE 07088]|uniref:TIR domain-containing protein n=1 Tax=Nodosilinea sp. LEGE 07088 TaxID=2777968 RepID=UPI00187FD5EC|nr:TIR domain-containing protein [Nodosilinea sp. LEGE 07088]MBE9139213.1 TIR domain-containing protein [Nodosilinea sp. LEGE 07088]